jgi:hypothetical protein
MHCMVFWGVGASEWVFRCLLVPDHDLGDPLGIDDAEDVARVDVLQTQRIC